MQGLREANVARETDVYLANPVLPDEILKGTSTPLWAGGVELVLGCSWGILGWERTPVPALSLLCRLALVAPA